MAKVLWSDASRQMAHNLDDLYERWIERRRALTEEEQRHEPQRYSELLLPGLPELDELGIEDLKALKSEIVMKIHYFQGKCAEVKKAVKGKRYARSEYVRLLNERDAAAWLASQAQWQVTTLNEALKGNGVEFRNKHDQEYIGWMRKSLYNALRLNQRTERSLAVLIEELLDHHFEIGEPALFSEAAGE